MRCVAVVDTQSKMPCCKEACQLLAIAMDLRLLGQSAHHGPACIIDNNAIRCGFDLSINLSTETSQGGACQQQRLKPLARTGGCGAGGQGNLCFMVGAYNMPHADLPEV